MHDPLFESDEARIKREMRLRTFVIYLLDSKQIKIVASKYQVMDHDIVFYCPAEGVTFALDEGVPWQECARFHLDNIQGCSMPGGKAKHG